MTASRSSSPERALTLSARDTFVRLFAIACALVGIDRPPLRQNTHPEEAASGPRTVSVAWYEDFAAIYFQPLPPDDPGPGISVRVEGLETGRLIIGNGMRSPIIERIVTPDDWGNFALEVVHALFGRRMVPPSHLEKVAALIPADAPIPPATPLPSPSPAVAVPFLIGEEYAEMMRILRIKEGLNPEDAAVFISRNVDFCRGYLRSNLKANTISDPGAENPSKIKFVTLSPQRIPGSFRHPLLRNEGSDRVKSRLGQSIPAEAVTRGDFVYRTSSLDPKEFEVGSAQLEEPFRLLQIVADQACNIRLYRTRKDEVADRNRPLFTGPDNVQGLIAEFQFTPAMVGRVLPVTAVSLPGSFYVKVQNLEQFITSIDVSFLGIIVPSIEDGVPVKGVRVSYADTDGGKWLYTNENKPRNAADPFPPAPAEVRIQLQQLYSRVVPLVMNCRTLNYTGGRAPIVPDDLQKALDDSVNVLRRFYGPDWEATDYTPDLFGESRYKAESERQGAMTKEEAETLNSSFVGQAIRDLYGDKRISLLVHDRLFNALLEIEREYPGGRHFARKPVRASEPFPGVTPAEARQEMGLPPEAALPQAPIPNESNNPEAREYLPELDLENIALQRVANSPAGKDIVGALKSGEISAEQCRGILRRLILSEEITLDKEKQTHPTAAALNNRRELDASQRTLAAVRGESPVTGVPMAGLTTTDSNFPPAYPYGIPFSALLEPIPGLPGGIAPAGTDPAQTVAPVVPVVPEDGPALTPDPSGNVTFDIDVNRAIEVLSSHYSLSPEEAYKLLTTDTPKAIELIQDAERTPTTLTPEISRSILLISRYFALSPTEAHRLLVTDPNAAQDFVRQAVDREAEERAEEKSDAVHARIISLHSQMQEAPPEAGPVDIAGIAGVTVEPIQPETPAPAPPTTEGNGNNASTVSSETTE